MPRKNNKKKNAQPPNQDILPQSVEDVKSQSQEDQRESMPANAIVDASTEIPQTTNHQGTTPSHSHKHQPHHRIKVTEEEFIINEHLDHVSLWSTIVFFFRHSIRDIKRRKFHYSLAFCSVFIVVLSSLVINTVVEKGPIIFLRLAEFHHGEIDGYVTPVGQDNNDSPQFLNYSRVVDLYGKDRFNLSPRKFVHETLIVFDYKSKLYDTEDPRSKTQWLNSFDKKLNLPIRENLQQISFQVSSNTKILAINTKREREIDLGREYLYPPMELGECYMTKKQQDKYVGNAQVALMGISLKNIMNLVIEKYNKQADLKSQKKLPENNDGFYVKAPCRITFIEHDSGKFTPHWGEYILMEYDRLLELASYYLPEPYHTEDYKDFQEFLRTPQLLDEFADHFVVTMPKPRISHFENPDITVIRSKIANYMGQIQEAMGFFPINVVSELLYDLSNYTKLVLFIGLIFDLIVVLLIIISILLIYSLLLINIETKSFEIGVQRMVGLSKTGLIAIVLVQSFLFVVPAVITGFIMSLPALQMFSQVLMALLHIDVQSIPTNNAIAQALVIGIVIPLLSSIIPINVALAKNLNDALDYQRSKTQAVYMEVLQKGKRNISGLLSFGIFACGYGVSIYYILPLALLSFNLTLILRIFVFILFGMLFALTLIALNTQRLFEIAFTNIFLYFEQASIKIMVLKNLMAHRSRNKLTAIIYSLGLGFIIFLNVAYKVQLETLRLHELRFRAGYLQIQIEEPQWALSPKLIEPVLKKHIDLIESFSWIPCELKKNIDLRVKESHLNDFSRTGGHLVGIYGVQPSLFKATHTELLDIGYKNKTSKLDITEELYTARGSQSVGIGSIVTEKAAVDPSDYRQTMILDIKSDIRNQMYQVRPLFTLNMAPGFTMTDMDLSIYNKQALLMSLPMFATIARARISELPMERLVIKLKDYHNDNHIKTIKKAIGKALDESGYQGQHYQLRDVFEDQKALGDIEIILYVIFSFVIPITMFLCFFSLTASMSANLFEQSKEIGILRAIGFQSTYVVRLTVYEAFILVISSSILGVFIGTFVGWIMTLQQGMFLQVPLEFLFPTTQFIQISVFSVVCGILSAYGPTKSLLRNSIAKIFRIA